MAPDDWKVVSNEAEAINPSDFKLALNDAAKSLNVDKSFDSFTAYEFDETQILPIYTFALYAGPFEVF